MINKKTKIVATISDLYCEIEFLQKLHDEGVDVVRLNTAHQTFADTQKVIKNVREVSDRMALLLDTKGPEIRTTKVSEKIDLKKGEEIKIKGSRSQKESSRDMLYVNYANFAKDVPIGSSVLIDDGEIELKVLSKKKGYLICKAKDGGLIKSNKSVNLPGVHIKLPSLSQKDKDYILFAVENNLDFIAHSFVRNKDDVLAIQKILDKHKSQIKIIAKIENQEGIDNIEEILEHAYGVMVARGDLAIEIPAEQVPIIQKQLINLCISRQKPIITATQMLHTMISHPRPSRAEVSDVANAVLDGTDAIMLSGETAYGYYPIQAVKMMTKIVLATEDKMDVPDMLPSWPSNNEITGQIARSAVRIAHDLNVKEIMISSKSGFSAELIASYRGSVPVFAKCFDPRRVRELALTYGVNAHLVKPASNKVLLTRIIKRLVKKNKLKSNDLILHLFSDMSEYEPVNAMEVFKVDRYI